MTFSTSLKNNGVPAAISVTAAITKPLTVATITRQPTGFVSDTTPRRRAFNEITKTPAKDASTTATSSASPPFLTPPLRHEGKVQRK